MKKIHLVLLIVLTAAFFAHAQTAVSPNYAYKLTPLTKADKLRYKYGLRVLPDYVDSRFRCDSDVDFDTNVEFARMSKGMVSIFFISVRARELVYEQRQDKVRAMSDYFVRIRDAEKTVDGGFESEIVDLTETPVLVADKERKFVVRKMLDLPPGRYRADTTLRDRTSGCRGRSSKTFTVPEFEKGNPILSTLMLGEPLDMLALELPAEFRNFPLRMVPVPSGIFKQGDRIAIFYSLNIPIIEPCWTAACIPAPDDVEYQVEKGGKILMRFKQDWKYYSTDNHYGRVLTNFSTASLKPGKYTITATVKVRKTGKSFTQSDVFSITGKQK